MRLGNFYNQVIKFGKLCDPRRDSRISSYADTAILYGKNNLSIKKILIGIDMEVAELLLADRIRQDKGLDLVIAHHPEGKAFASLFKVMQLQVDILKKTGIPVNVAQELLDERMFEVERKLLPQNHTRAVDAARLLDMPFMCIHTPADNHASMFIERLMRAKNPKKVQEIIDILLDVEEYRIAQKSGAGPQIILGNPGRDVGKIMVEMTGGTEGPADVYEKLQKKGIRTIIGMHLSEEHFKKVKDANLNVVIAGHISSDTLGLNLLLDRIEQSVKEEFKTISCSGFNRVKRSYFK